MLSDFLFSTRRAAGEQLSDPSGKLDQILAIQFLPAAGLSLPSAPLTSLSTRHSSSAFSNPCASTNNPCRSYRFRARLHFRTTADNVEYLRAHLVSAASPDGRKSR